jgi:hypothetical protein
MQFRGYRDPANISYSICLFFKNETHGEPIKNGLGQAEHLEIKVTNSLEHAL